jgi:hypothetical protein
MGCLVQLFTVEELQALDEKQLVILRDVLLNELRTSPDIRAVLDKKLRPMYEQYKSRDVPAAPARRSVSRPAPRKK